MIVIKIVTIFAVVVTLISIIAKAIKESPPPWENVFTKEEMDEFTMLVTVYFTNKGHKIEFGEALVVDGNKEMVYGLNNLAEFCKASPRSEWPEIISNHFDNMEKAKQFSMEFGEKVKNFDEVKDYIAVTIYPPEYLEQVGGPKYHIYRNDLGGTVTFLVFDLPYSIQTVPREDAKAWGKSDEELFELAIQNLAKKVKLEREVTDIEGKAKIIYNYGDNILVAANVLRLDDLPDCVGKEGSIVSIPTRSTLICSPINDKNILLALKSLPLIASKWFADGPGSITDKLFFYREGKFIEFPYWFKGKRLEIMPPDEFNSLMNKLTKE